MKDFYKVISYNLGNGANSCKGRIKNNQFFIEKSSSIFDRKKTVETTLNQAKLLKSMKADFLLIQELTGLTPMNAFVKTKEIFL